MMLESRAQVWTARDAVNAVGCRPDPTNDGKLVYATCALNNRSVFWDFAGLRRLQPSEITGVRLMRHVEVSARAPDFEAWRLVDCLDVTERKTMTLNARQ